jgi:hypothetical protein
MWKWRAMNVRSATAQDAAGIVGLHRSANPFGEWFRDPFQKLGRVPYEDLTPLERYLHGGFGMDLSLFRRHLHEYLARGFPVFVAEHEGKIVGECEVWLDDEPAPFGRYGEVEMLETGSPPKPEVARMLVARAAERMEKLGIHALDMSPLHGGSEDVVNLGFEPLWDTREFEGEMKSVPRPAVEFEAKFLAGDYREIGLMVALNHREPARWRFETITALWPAAHIAGLQDATKAVAMAVETEAQRFAVLAARREWLLPATAEVDVWMDPLNVNDETMTHEAFQIAVEIARRLGTKTARTYAPPQSAKVVRDLGFAGGDAPDPWLRWSL